MDGFRDASEHSAKHFRGCIAGVERGGDLGDRAEI